MTDIKLVASRHSAFYSPLISMVAGGFLEAEGLSGSYRPVSAGENSGVEVAEGRADVGQSAVSGSWTALDAGTSRSWQTSPQINTRDGFHRGGSGADAEFNWEKLLSADFLYVHGGQPEAMLRYGLHQVGIDLSDVTGIESPGGDEMMSQWRGGSGQYFHEQGAFPQQLEHEGIGQIVGSVGEIVGPTAFSSLVCRWDWLETDEAKRVDERVPRLSCVGEFGRSDGGRTRRIRFLHMASRSRLLPPPSRSIRALGLGQAISRYRGNSTIRRWMCSSTPGWSVRGIPTSR